MKSRKQRKPRGARTPKDKKAQVPVESDQFEKLPIADWDFGYLKGLPKHLQRIAAYWEYARESKEMLELAQCVRDLPQSRRHYQELLDRYQAILDPRGPILLGNPMFPVMPFHQLLTSEFLQPQFYSATDFGLSKTLAWLPMDRFAPIARLFKDNPFVEGRLVGLMINWEPSDDQITEMFRELLKKHRPRDRPQPRRAGRGGALSQRNALDMLNQLSALRLDRNGFTFETARNVMDRHPYSSQKGWRLGIKRASERIANMGVTPFF